MKRIVWGSLLVLSITLSPRLGLAGEIVSTGTGEVVDCVCSEASNFAGSISSFEPSAELDRVLKALDKACEFALKADAECSEDEEGQARLSLMRTETWLNQAETLASEIFSSTCIGLIDSLLMEDDVCLFSSEPPPLPS